MSPMVISKLFFKAVVIYFIILLSTFGWKTSPKYKKTLSEEEAKSSKNLKKIVTVLSEDIGTRNYEYYSKLGGSADFIIKSFQELGYAVDSMSYNINGRTFKNIIAERLDENRLNDVLIIGAHYDSCFNPGADDNASGIAVMLELARLVKGTKLKHRFKFIAFVNEEPPFFQTDKMGSLVYTRRIKFQRQTVKAAVILEMLGYYSERPFSQKYLPLLGPFYPNKADFIAVVGNFLSRSIAQKIYFYFKEKSDFPIEKVVLPGFMPGVNFSDHWSFWEAGIPAIMVTDTAYLRNRHYHTQTDLAKTLNFDKMAKVVFGLKDAVIELDNDLSQ